METSDNHIKKFNHKLVRFDENSKINKIKYSLGKETEKQFAERQFKEFLRRISNFVLPKNNDEIRIKNANAYGGIDFNDVEGTSKIRSCGWDIIKQIGRKIISGDFNLTTISFPIRVMIPKTILQSIADALFQYPIYLQIASEKTDPIERLKYVLTATISCFPSTTCFLKPLNPIIGETFEMYYDDGSKIYLEQTSHHPPISHFYMIGANNAFKFHGHSNYHSGAGMNSMTLTNKGKRFIEFNDGTKISYGFPIEHFSNSFFGTMKVESKGFLEYVDEKNNLTCKINFCHPKKPTDFFSGEIMRGEESVCKVYGSYLNYIEFDNVRYWDIRENWEINEIYIENQLPSSALYREDRVLLEQDKVIEAQAAKEVLENIQRNDRKLRKEWDNKRVTEKKDEEDLDN